MSKSKTQRKYNKRPFNKYGKSTFKNRVPYKKRRGKSKTYKLINSKQRKNRIKRTKKKYGGDIKKEYPYLTQLLCCWDDSEERDQEFDSSVAWRRQVAVDYLRNVVDEQREADADAVPARAAGVRVGRPASRRARSRRPRAPTRRRQCPPSSR